MEPEEAIHIEATLLPAYVSRTLSKEEQQQMEEHLKTCPICPRELQEIIAMQAILKTLSTNGPALHQMPFPR
ncbi:MAG: zf-HC2 domain-containing protein [Nitrospira sp.]|nr:zf-HC2 domain-containing protein [Nitrospira sp.]